MTSNELFKIFINQQVTLIKRNIITPDDASKGIQGYYRALQDLNGVDELTKLYKELSGYALTGTLKQKETALSILSGKKDLSDLIL